MTVLQTGLGYAAWPSPLPPRQEKAAMVAQTGGAKTASPAGHVRGPSCFDLAACAEINNSRQGVLTRRRKLDHTPGDTVRGLPINTPTAKHCPLDAGHGQCRSVPYVPASARRNVRSHACPSFDLQNQRDKFALAMRVGLAKTDFN